MFINAFLDTNNPIHSRTDGIFLATCLAVVDMQAYGARTIGAREHSRTWTAMLFQQLNTRWFGTTQGGPVGLESLEVFGLQQSVIFHIDDDVYRVMKVYSKTHNKWLEIESVPLIVIAMSSKKF